MSKDSITAAGILRASVAGLLTLALPYQFASAGVPASSLVRIARRKHAASHPDAAGRRPRRCEPKRPCESEPSREQERARQQEHPRESE